MRTLSLLERLTIAVVAAVAALVGVLKYDMERTAASTPAARARSNIIDTAVVVSRHSNEQWRMRAREGDAPSTVPKGSSRALAAASTDVRLAPRVALPNDLSTSLRYLGDAELQRLLAAVSKEISRRSQGATTSDTGKTAATAASQSMDPRNQASDVQQIPEGKANLIRASFGAGLKPAAIARMFRVSPSLVKRIISSTEKSKR